MKATQAEVMSVEEHSGIYSMWLDTGGFDGAPGQFVNVYLPDATRLLPRPLGICEHDGRRLRLVFQVAGGGTRLLSSLGKGERVKILGGLGNGFEVQPSGRHVLVGGGIGIPPLIGLVQQLRRDSAEVMVFLGGRTAGFLEYLAEDFKRVGASVSFATDDGSLGYHGNAVELMKKNIAFATKTESLDKITNMIYACGPRPMLKAVAAYDGAAQVAMEERMACGIGACVGCVVKTKSGLYKKVCKDGPVFRGDEVVWDE